MKSARTPLSTATELAIAYPDDARTQADRARLVMERLLIDDIGNHFRGDDEDEDVDVAPTEEEPEEEEREDEGRPMSRVKATFERREKATTAGFVPLLGLATDTIRDGVDSFVDEADTAERVLKIGSRTGTASLNTSDREDRGDGEGEEGEKGGTEAEPAPDAVSRAQRQQPTGLVAEMGLRIKTGLAVVTEIRDRLEQLFHIMTHGIDPVDAADILADRLAREMFDIVRNGTALSAMVVNACRRANADTLLALAGTYGSVENEIYRHVAAAMETSAGTLAGIMENANRVTAHVLPGITIDRHQKQARPPHHAGNGTTHMLPLGNACYALRDLALIMTEMNAFYKPGADWQRNHSKDKMTLSDRLESVNSVATKVFAHKFPGSHIVISVPLEMRITEASSDVYRLSAFVGAVIPHKITKNTKKRSRVAFFARVDHLRDESAGFARATEAEALDKAANYVFLLHASQPTRRHADETRTPAPSSRDVGEKTATSSGKKKERRQPSTAPTGMEGVFRFDIDPPRGGGGPPATGPPHTEQKQQGNTGGVIEGFYNGDYVSQMEVGEALHLGLRTASADNDVYGNAVRKAIAEVREAMHERAAPESATRVVLVMFYESPDGRDTRAVSVRKLVAEKPQERKYRINEEQRERALKWMNPYAVLFEQGLAPARLVSRWHGQIQDLRPGHENEPSVVSDARAYIDGIRARAQELTERINRVPERPPPADEPDHRPPTPLPAPGGSSSSSSSSTSTAPLPMPAADHSISFDGTSSQYPLPSIFPMPLDDGGWTSDMGSDGWTINLEASLAGLTDELEEYRKLTARIQENPVSMPKQPSAPEPEPEPEPAPVNGSFDLDDILDQLGSQSQSQFEF